MRIVYWDGTVAAGVWRCAACRGMVEAHAEVGEDLGNKACAIRTDRLCDAVEAAAERGIGAA